SAQIREILISESAWEEMTCLFAPSLAKAKKSAQKILEKKSVSAILTLRTVPISGQWTLTR
ncbi:hypothetical protein RAF74_25375, partial [Klebsiella quasipneumoniae subsp. similipneumoniae]